MVSVLQVIRAVRQRGEGTKASGPNEGKDSDKLCRKTCLLGSARHTPATDDLEGLAIPDKAVGVNGEGGLLGSCGTPEKGHDNQYKHVCTSPMLHRSSLRGDASQSRL